MHGIAEATVREPVHFTVQLQAPRNSHDDSYEEPNVFDLSVSIRGVSRCHPYITPCGKGKFDVEWKPMLSGHYIVTVRYMGRLLPGTPFTVSVSAPEPCATQCVITGESLSKAVAHRTNNFAVSFRDKLGSITGAADLDVFCEPVQKGSPRGRETKNRKIRVKVSGRAISVRAAPELDSEQIGTLLPGAVITVIEERISRNGDVQAAVALDYIAKADRKELRGPSSKVRYESRERGLSFRSSPSARMGGNRRSGDAGGRSKPAAEPPPLPENLSKSALADVAARAPSQLSTRPTMSNPLDPIAEDAEEDQAPTEAASVVGGAEKSRGGHAKVQSRLGMKLSTATSLEQGQQQAQQQQSSGQASQRQSSSRLSSTRQGSQRSHRKSKSSARKQHDSNVGWATIVKEGTKFVTSRMRLNVETRQHHQQQWQRRVNNMRTVEALTVSSAASAMATVGRPTKSSEAMNKAVLKSLSLELESAKGQANGAAFAFGGVYPGRLHSHGKLTESHRVFYSVGVAGTYLLHVRLRHQAAALPGSPFLLNVAPGDAYALSTRLPSQLMGEVGGRCSCNIATFDQVGNPCIEGGSALTCSCDPEDQIQTAVSDHRDGSYTITWDGKCTGTFRVGVMIDGVHLEGSPMQMTLTSATADISRCSAFGPGLTRAVKNEKATIYIRFEDVFGNVSSQTMAFRASFRASMMVASPGAKITSTSKHPETEFVGTWLEEVDSFQNGVYCMTYTPQSAGAYALHLAVWSRDGERSMVIGSPFELSVHTSNSDGKSQSAISETIDSSGISSGDYKISRDVFDEAKRKWGECTIDAFASGATTCISRFWSCSPMPGAAAVDAFVQPWAAGERIWAHPPLDLIEAFCELLTGDSREAEVIVCAPYRPTADWYFKLVQLSDDKRKHMAGKLVGVADDAPPRVREWPIVIFHVPGRTSKAPKASKAPESGEDDEELWLGDGEGGPDSWINHQGKQPQ